MADALRLAPLLLLAFAIEPAAAEPLRPSVKLQSIDAVRFHEPPSPTNDPALRLRLFPGDEQVLPAWSLPFGTRADDRDRRGMTFSVRPGRGLKATAKIRF